MTTTPAGNEPHRPGGPLAPTAPGKPPLKLTTPQKYLVALALLGGIAIAGIGFAGSYNAVTQLALDKGFGDFSYVFTIGIDAGIGVLLAVDLLLTWLRIPFPMLRQTAWLLTAATIAFNAVVSWPDPIGTAMHGVIPILFVIAVEAARHAIGRIADITADKFMEGPPVSCWFLKPIGTFILWRRQRLWMVRTWARVLDLEQERRIYVSTLRREHGRRWRRKATADQLLVVRLATKDGLSIAEAVARPQREADKLAAEEAERRAAARAKAEVEAEAKHQAELRTTEAEAKRRAELAEAEAAEARARAEAEAAEAEAKSRAEASAETARLEVEAKRREDAEAARLLAAETEAKLAAIARTEQQARAEAELKQQQRAAEQRRIQQEEQARLRAQAAAEEQARRDREAAEARARREQEAHDRAQRITRAASASASPTSAPAAKQATTSARTSTSVSPIGGPRAKRQTEVEKVLARLVEANDPKSYPLEDVMRDFDLKQTTAYDRLKTAQDLFTAAQAEARNTKSA